MNRTESMKREAEEVVRERGWEIETWLDDRTFVDTQGAYGRIFSSERAARNAVTRGPLLPDAKDYVAGMRSGEDWVEVLQDGGYSEGMARRIVRLGQWGGVVRNIVMFDGPEFFLSPGTGGCHALSSGILYY